MTVSVAAPLRAARWLALATPVLALAGAYIGQYVFGLHPCEMCWWQRYGHFFAIPFALIAFWWRPVSPLVAVAALGILSSGLIGGFHAGVEYGWWEGMTACTANPFIPGSDPLDAIMNAPVIRCDVAPWTVWGVSLAGLNFLLSTGSALAIFALVGISQRGER